MANEDKTSFIVPSGSKQGCSSLVANSRGLPDSSKPFLSYFELTSLHTGERRLSELVLKMDFLNVFGVPIPPEAKVELDFEESVTVMLHCCACALALAVLAILGVLYLLGGGQREFEEKMLLLLICKGSFM